MKTIENNTFEGGLDDVGEPMSCSGDDWGLLVGILLDAPEIKKNTLIRLLRILFNKVIAIYKNYTVKTVLL